MLTNGNEIYNKNTTNKSNNMETEKPRLNKALFHGIPCQTKWGH
jgi:hypothetical protein